MVDENGKEKKYQRGKRSKRVKIQHNHVIDNGSESTAIYEVSERMTIVEDPKDNGRGDNSEGTAIHKVSERMAFVEDSKDNGRGDSSECTAIHKVSEHTAIVEVSKDNGRKDNSEVTIVDEDSEGTAIVDGSEGTAIVDESEGTAIVDDSEGTAIDEDSEGTAIDEDSEGTAIDEDSEGIATVDDSEDNSRKDGPGAIGGEVKFKGIATYNGDSIQSHFWGFTGNDSVDILERKKVNLQFSPSPPPAIPLPQISPDSSPDPPEDLEDIPCLFELMSQTRTADNTITTQLEGNIELLFAKEK